MASDTKHPATFSHAGWWVPGSLEAGWSRTFQANFNDMLNKFQQLGIAPLVKSLPGGPDVGFYFSEAEYDFLQLLTLAGGPRATPGQRLPTLPMVAYSVWLASQGWGHFSPISLLQVQGVTDELTAVQPPASHEFPCGWYLTGSFTAAWYQDVPGNYELARLKRKELGLADVSPLYFAESTLYDFIQLVQAPGRPPGRGPDEGAVAEYAAWFATQAYGHLSFVPFMSLDLVEAALLQAGRNP